MKDYAFFMGHPKIDRRSVEASRRNFQQTRAVRPIGFTAITPEVARAQNANPVAVEPTSPEAYASGQYDYAGQVVAFAEPKGRVVDSRPI
jgi:hypothetical protein